MGYIHAVALPALSLRNRLPSLSYATCAQAPRPRRSLSRPIWVSRRSPSEVMIIDFIQKDQDARASKCIGCSARSLAWGYP